jgi:general secretion pathway protein B
MSLILEALKKSEAKRRLGEAPDLGTPFATRDRQRSSLPFIVTAIVVAGVAGWWWLRPSAPPTAPAAQASPAHGAAAVTAKTPMRPQLQNPLPAHPATPARNAVANVRTGPKPPVETAPASTSQWVAAPAPGGGMPNYKRKFEMSRQQVSTPPSAVPPPAAPTPPTPKPAAPPVTVAPPPAPALAPATTARAAPMGKAPKTAATIGVQVPTPAVAAFPAGTKSYAELPFSVRKALPALKLSMHVYAADPAQRFVILNDSRMVEGDKTSDEVTLREIRPDGVVLEFQGQRFFYPRDGF